MSTEPKILYQDRDPKKVMAAAGRMLGFAPISRERLDRERKAYESMIQYAAKVARERHPGWFPPPLDEVAFQTGDTGPEMVDLYGETK